MLVLCGRLLLHWVSGSGPGRKEFDLTEKTLHTSRVSQFNHGHVCGRDCIVVLSSVSLPDHKRRRRDQDDGEHVPAQVRTGVG